MDIKTIVILISSIYGLFCVKMINAFARGVVVRDGQIVKLVGPGLVLIKFPFEKIIIVDIKTEISDFQTLSPQEIDEKIKQIAMTKI